MDIRKEIAELKYLAAIMVEKAISIESKIGQPKGEYKIKINRSLAKREASRLKPHKS